MNNLDLVSSIVFLIAGLLIFFRDRKNDSWDVFAPSRIFATVWFLSLAVSSLHLSAFDKTWKTTTYLLFIMVPLIFTAGVYLASLLYSRWGWEKQTDSSPPDIRSFWSAKKFFVLIIVLFVVSFGTFIYELYVLHAIPLFNNPNVTRWSLSVGSYPHRIALTLVQVVSIASLYLILSKNKLVEYRSRIFAIAVVALVSVALMASRLFLLTAVMVPIISFNYGYKRFRPRQAAVIFTIIVLSVGVMGLYRFISTDRNQFVRYMNALGFYGNSVWIAPVYQNIASNFKVFDLLTDVIPEETGGYFNGYFISYPLRVFTGDRTRITSFIGNSRISSSGFVASTFLGAFYADFGFAGVIIGVFLLGFFSMLVYRKMTSQFHPFWILLYSSIAWNLIFAVYENLFVLFDFWWAIAVYGLFHCLVRNSNEAVSI